MRRSAIIPRSTRSRRARRAGQVVVITTVVFLGLLAAAPADADVLVNAPLANLCFGHTIDVGVWDRDAGSTPFEVKVFDPTGALVFDKGGAAPAQWQFWHIVPKLVGAYRVTY